MQHRSYQVIVIGGGHAGVEAAWAAANLLAATSSVALVTLDPSKIGVMSCNPAIGGLAKGQIVREVDAMGGVMGLAADAAGIQFKVLNASKGAAVRGPRAQCDKHAYADAIQRLIASRPEIDVIGGAVDQFVVNNNRIEGVIVGDHHLAAPAVVLTTGTFMRGLMHTGHAQTPGGRFGEAPAQGISATLRELGFELGRLKTGTPPRLRRGSIRWDELTPAPGDDEPTPFSDLSGSGFRVPGSGFRVFDPPAGEHVSLTRDPIPSLSVFPVLPQISCALTSTTRETHELIRANLDRAPMFTGQIEGAGPRYCPSIEDKVVRFAERESHQVFLEPESLRDDWVYCNGISTSLPADVQDRLVRAMPGCENAEILRYGYAVEYDMVKPHQIAATAMTKLVEGLFLAGQINGTSGYEEAAGQGLVAGINAVRFSRGEPLITLGRDRAYIGVLMDDLVTKTPTEPYRMFSSRAEHRLLLRADNSADRLTPLASELGLLATTDLGRLRLELYEKRRTRLAELGAIIDTTRIDGVLIADMCRRPEFSPESLAELLESRGVSLTPADAPVVFTAHTERFYSAYIERQHAEVRRSADTERTPLPADMEYAGYPSLRMEARVALERFRPATLGQALRLEGVTPADITLLAVLVKRHARHVSEPRASARGSGIS